MERSLTLTIILSLFAALFGCEVEKSQIEDNISITPEGYVRLEIHDADLVQKLCRADLSHAFTYGCFHTEEMKVKKVCYMVVWTRDEYEDTKTHEQRHCAEGFFHKEK